MSHYYDVAKAYADIMLASESQIMARVDENHSACFKLLLATSELLMLMYPRCRREAEAAFLLGTYMELVDKEVVWKQKARLTSSGVIAPSLVARYSPQQ